MDEMRRSVYRTLGYREDSAFRHCPFCNGVALVEERERFERLQKENGQACLIVRCDTCEARMDDYTFDVKSYDIRLMLLRKAWNRRDEES